MFAPRGTTIETRLTVIDKLPADLRTLVLKAAKDATIQQRKNMQKEEGAFKAKVIKAGMKANTLSAADKKPFVAATVQVYKQFEKDLGPDLMAIVKQVQK